MGRQVPPCAGRGGQEGLLALKLNVWWEEAAVPRSWVQMQEAGDAWLQRRHPPQRHGVEVSM